ncbi:flagellar hook-basal body protein [Lentibacillus cibarius]|uniref:Flagellar hook-basal body protein n=1 Tax=Lentibacillus cibarius TaxID=2583219 RepID=A0A5S3QJ64_9BACI|nr:flagellar hook-basal body protein [Lentibacillus cibarius]TMN21972.1 flagellar hook-basal body protein [Lentibacillus cibarius]
MLRGFYTATSGMIAQQRRQEALSNNIANANTPGYKADQPVVRAFPEMLMYRMGKQHVPIERPVQDPIGSLHTGVYVQENVPNYGQGDVRDTGNSTDLALRNESLPDETGSLFFTVQNADGERRYTRNGNFTVDGNGFLTTQQGYYVLDEAGAPVQTGGMDFDVTEQGVVQADGQATPLGIAYTDNANTLTKEGSGLFRGEAGGIPAGAGYTVRQGALERSNLDATQAMTQMMESYRTFETNQRVLKAYDKSMGKAVSEIARLR